ncbi:MAG: family 2 glycosyl transferase [Parcubacteria group bacterium]|nr:family 2 glycosyl transferase [Parcubacteria group bacterium]
MDTHTEKIIPSTAEPLVSITMTTYNRAGYIEEAIRSVIAQIYENWELVIVDDGSSDDTQARVKSFNDSRIRYLYHETNKGIYQTRTDAVAASQGTYIAVLDSDDVWSSPEKLANQVMFLEMHADLAVVGTFITLIDGDGKEIGKDQYSIEDADIRASILIRNQFAHSSVMMRASLIEKVGGYRNIGLAEDLDLFLRLGAYGKFANIPKYMTQYRIHAGGITRSKLPMARCVHSIIKTYRTQYPNYLPALLKSYLRLLLARVR